jgi:hypothetical protein
MQEDGIVSLWIGDADSAQLLEAYMTIGFTEDGDLIPSTFATEFDIDYYDEDFREATHRETAERFLSDLLRGSSYADVIAPKFTTLCGNSIPQLANAKVLLYNFNYMGGSKAVTIGPVRLRYVGAVTYR